MIKRAQIRFIALTMSILFFVFGVLFLGTSIIFRIGNDKNIERTLDETYYDYYFLGKTDLRNSLIVKFAFDPSSNGYVRTTISLDEQTFSQENSQRILDVALKSNYVKGKTGTFYYKIYESDNSYFIVVNDCSEIYDSYSTALLSVFIILLTAFAILFIIVYLLSFRIFRPIKDSFYNQKRFISNASHELKTPLAIISANTDVLEQDSDNQWINNIKSQTARMSNLVEDMLSLAKMDEGTTKLKMEKFNLSDEIFNASLPFEVLAFEKGKKLLINVEPNIIYNGNKACVNQLVNILLDNAVKHSDRNGEILIELKKEKNKNFVLTVFNTGSEVPDQQSNKVFERFYRADSSRSRETGGSGLGMSIAKSVADLNKWKISAISKQNESMTIIVVF
ncbi:MAG: HAMP domain-containing histidine kinase [Clostridia bacterium]|nr:HAMP domain-containing histidine kinase [Clostridia bacterium]